MAVTLDELLAELRLPKIALEHRCSEEHVTCISEFLKWRRVAPHLGLTQTDQDDIDRDFKSESEKRRECLRRWKEIHAFKATYLMLVEALLMGRLADDAEKVCKLVRKSTKGPKDQSDETIAKIEQLEERYDTLVVRVESLVKQKAKSVSEFRRKLTLLPSRMVNREELEQNLEKHLSVIYHADSIEEIFGLLNLRVWNYLNYHLLQYIAQVYGDVETNRMMEDYIATVEEFKSSTTLHMFLSVQSKRKCPEVPATLRRELEQVMFTHHKLSLESTLTEVECFRRDLAQHFSLPEFTTIIVEIEPGSVTTVWLMTLSAATVLQERIEEGDLNFLRAHEITKLRVDGKTVYSADQVESSTPPSFHDHHSTPETTDLGAPPPLPTPLMTTAQPQEQSTTLPSEVPLPQTSPPVRRAQRFDFLLALLSAGVPHIVSIILYLVDLKTLRVAQGVSSYWWYIIEVLPRWKEEVKRNLATSPLWKQLMERRGWDKYISQEILHSESINQQYRRLYRAVVKEIHSLETNWSQGHYTLSKIETGSPVLCLKYNSKMIVSGHDDGTIKIWDKDTLQLLNTLMGHKGLVLCLQFNEEVIISGSSDTSFKVWDIQTGLIVNDLQHHKDTVRSLKFTKEFLVTGSDDHTVAVWDFKSPIAITLRMVLKGHEDEVNAVDISGSYVVSGADDRSIKVWDSTSGELLHTLQHSDQVWSLQCTGKVMLSGCRDGTIRLWDLEIGRFLREWRGHERPINSVAFDDNRIVTGSDDNTVKVWSMSAVLEPSSSTDTLNTTTLKEHSNTVLGFQFDNFEVVSGGYDRMIYIRTFINDLLPTTILDTASK